MSRALLGTLLFAFAGAGCVELPGPIEADTGDRDLRPYESATQEAVATQVGTEIILHGNRYDIGAPVVLWTDPGGFNAYDTAIRPDTDPPYVDETSGARYRTGRREALDQFVLHYDVCGTSSRCFEVLHHLRGLSVQFMLDIDGTLYQTMDIDDTAWHATRANDRSLGVEIAQIGARLPSKVHELDEWYAPGRGGTRLTLPLRFAGGGVRTPHFEGYAARPNLIEGRINGSRLLQYDFTTEQYETLARLLAVLTTELPGLPLRFPRNADGSVRRDVFTDQQFEDFRGILGHYHVQKNKTDPGPAFDWERLELDIRELSVAR